MPRKLSSDTERIYSWLWYLPWASAADIARITGLKDTAVSNALKRGKEEPRKWFLSARLGRVFQAVDRYVVSNAGIEELQTRFGWTPFWWHTADGVKALARRLEIVELAYTYLPGFWQSNAVSRPHVYVYYEARQYTSASAGEPTRRMELLELNWDRARLVDFHWLKTKSFEAIATYSNGSSSDGPLHLPVLWHGFFQKPDDIASVRRDMREVLVEDERCESIPEKQRIGNHYPGMIVFCPDPVAAAVLKRNWMESRASNRDSGATPAIINAQGQVVRAMDPPTVWWSNFYLPPRGGDLKDISRTVASLGNGAYAAVNGLRAWRTFRAVDGSPGVTLEQIAESARVDTTVAGRLLQPMMKYKVLIRKADGHYLDQSGRGLLAYSRGRLGPGCRGAGESTRRRAGSTAALSASTTRARLRRSWSCESTATAHSPPWESSSKISTRAGRSGLCLMRSSYCPPGCWWPSSLSGVPRPRGRWSKRPSIIGASQMHSIRSPSSS